MFFLCFGRMSISRCLLA